MTKDSISHL